MIDAQGLYHELIQFAIRQDIEQARVSRVLLGLSWSVAEIAEPRAADAESGFGICFSPRHPARTLPWSGTLQGRKAVDLASWLLSWEPAQATVGTLMVNALVNSASPLLSDAKVIANDAAPHLRVFHHFRPQLADKKVAVIGRYPGLEPFEECRRWHCIERQETGDTMPDTAADFVLPEMDWVFITASAIANKTLPHLLNLSRSSTTVLMGPSLPWAPLWGELGVDYLAGVAVTDPGQLLSVAAEGGGTRLFDDACEYRVRRF